MSGITFQVNADFAAVLLKRFTLEAAEQTSGVSAHSNPILGKFCNNVRVHISTFYLLLVYRYKLQ